MLDTYYLPDLGHEIPVNGFPAPFKALSDIVRICGREQGGGNAGVAY